MELPARIGKYELEQFLGGGMSHVYRARDTVIGRTVALKILTEQGCNDPDAKARFLAEARMAGNIQHENIIQIYDYGEESGRPYMVMEFLVGQDLRDAIRNGSVGDLNNRLRIALQIASALEYVHSQKIVHRDIKPENVHLDASGKARLMDFGIAKTEDMALTKAGFALGTPYYMSPEQVLGEKVGEPADVYSFGVLLFEMLAGRKPVSAETIERLFYMILNEPLDLEPLRQAGVPEPVVTLIGRCTAKKIENRIQSFTTVRGELEKALGKSEPGPPPAPARGYSGKYITFALLALIAVGAGTIIWLKTRTQTRVLQPSLETKTGTMLLIPAGPFLHGPNREQAVVPAFYMDRTEVTNQAYAAFAADTSRPLPPGFPEDRPEYPVVNVTVTDANAFCGWDGKRLPDPLEWEKAARGPDGQIFPWGDQPDPTRANVVDNPNRPEPGLMPAGSMPEDASPYGLLHMAGNVLEYARMEITPSSGAVEHFGKILSPPPAINEPWYSVKGGAFTNPISAAVPWEFTAIPARFHSESIGFRCAMNPPTE